MEDEIMATAGEPGLKTWERPEVRQLAAQDAEGSLADTGADGGLYS